MRVVVADASSLILMAKCDLLVPYSARAHIVVPMQVLREAASPEQQRRHPDAVALARAAEEDLLHIRTVRSRRNLPVALGSGEAATIRLFLQEDASLVLSDDGRAIRACRVLGIPFTTTPRVVVDLHRAEALGLGNARRALEKLAVIGRYRNEIIASALISLKED